MKLLQSYDSKESVSKCKRELKAIEKYWKQSKQGNATLLSIGFDPTKKKEELEEQSRLKNHYDSLAKYLLKQTDQLGLDFVRVPTLPNTKTNREL